MMTNSFGLRRRWTAGLVLLSTSTLLQFGFLGACDSRLIELTQYFDPCGTILANCTPGSFQANAADIGDYCIDPICTVPGGCDQVDPPLGTQRELCP